MPQAIYHMAKSRYNVKVAAHLHDETAFTDWAVTATYYAALHLIDALLDGEMQLIKDERHPRKHSANDNPGNNGRGRNQLVRKLYGAIYRDYRSLEEASRRSRYDLEVLGESAYVKLQNEFKRIEQFTALQLGMRQPPFNGQPAGTAVTP